MPKRLLKGFPIIKKPSYNFRIGRFFLLLGFLFGLTLLLSPVPILPQYPKEGEFSQQTIKSPYVFYYEDKEATILKQKEVASYVPPVYTLDISIIPDVIACVSELFSIIEKTTQDKSISPDEVVKKVKERVKDDINISDEVLKKVVQYPKLFEIESDVCGILRAMLEHGLTNASKARIRNFVSENIKIQVVSASGMSEKIISKEEFYQFLFKEEIKSIADLTSVYPNILSSKDVYPYIFDIVMSYVKPNVIFNQKATKKDIKEAVKKVEPVMVKVDKGEKIVGDGERVDRLAAIKLRELNKRRTTISTNIILGFLILLYSLVILGAGYLYKYQGVIVSTKNLVLLGVIILIGGALGRLVLHFNLPVYVIPFAAISILISILFNEEFSVFITLFLSILMGFLVGGKFEFVIFFLAGGLAAIYTVSSARMLRDILKLGIAIGIANAIVIIGYSLIKQDFSTLGYDLFWGCLINAGIATTIAIVGLLYLERLFNVTTNFRLFELSDVNVPLLKKLLIEAPGTYHHSLLVGNLAEAAATEVSANPILCRVGGYYHDIGKIIRPAYFSENQMDENKHEDINPTLSVSVLKSHVKDGVEIAKEYRLPSEVVDIIQQHHGTSLITYFYQVQKEKQEDIDEAEFKYPGPKPQYKEAAIVMLADAVEAASRSLSKPTAVRIEEMVKKIINSKFADGELDECDLTLKELTKIGDVLMRLLTTIYHSRVEYPEEEKEPEKEKINTEEK